MMQHAPAQRDEIPHPHFLSWRMVDTVLPSKEAFLRAVQGKKKMRMYVGIDPTAPDLHVGHAANLFFLRDMQRLGHDVTLLVGDFTAQIGDPTGKDERRKPMTLTETRKNARTYRAQAGTLVAFSGRNPARILRNSDWLAKMSLREFFETLGRFTAQQLLERDMFRRRIEKGNPIGLHELLYPVLQGYLDPKALGADVQVGGTDQLYNMAIGRHALEEDLGTPAFAVTTKLLVNPKTGGKLMSKSEGNYISLAAKPADMYGKIMALPDAVVWDVFLLATDVSDSEIRALERAVQTDAASIRDAKAALARAVVGWVHSPRAAQNAEQEFGRVFREKSAAPRAAPTIVVPRRTALSFSQLASFLALHGLARSKTDARTLILGGAVRFQGSKIVLRDPKDRMTPVVTFDREGMLKVGARRFAKIVFQ